MKRIIILLLFLAGISFRMWLAYKFSQPFILDQVEYDSMARGILRYERHVFVTTYRLYGYPLFLASFYELFGGDNSLPWKVAQAIVDTSTGLLIFLIARKIFKKETPGWYGYILYLFNPFTAMFVGVRLTEVLTIFLITLIIFTLLRFWEKRDKLSLLILSLLLGFIPQVRPGYVYLSLAILCYLLYRVLRQSEKAILRVIILPVIMLFVLPFIYNIIGNYLFYTQFSPMTVDSLFVREFYISLFIDNQETVKSFPPEVNQIYYDYSMVRGIEERRAMENKYMQLAAEKIRKDPIGFFASRIRKLWYVWEKHQFFPYGINIDEAIATRLSRITYWGNMTLLASGLLGMVFCWKELRGKEFGVNRIIFVLAVILILYTSFLHAFTITSERFSLPAYPIIIMFAGYGLFLLQNQLFGKYNKSKK